jgi:hypothetical protein
MTLYPNADNSPGYDYAPDPGGLAYNNARTSGSFTVGADGTTTVVDANVVVGDIVLITASNLKGAAVIAGIGNTPSGIYVSSVVNGSFVVTHDNHADAEGSTFYYVAFPSF